MTELRLHDYSASGNCYKVRLLLAQLGRDYERLQLDIFDGDTLTPEFAELNHHRSTPVLELADGRVLIESNAILWYLATGTPFLASDAFGQAEVCRWLVYEQTDVMWMIGGLRFRLLTGRLEPLQRSGTLACSRGPPSARHPRSASPRPSIPGRGPLLDRGHAVYAYSHVAEEAGIDTSGYPAFRKWLDRVAGQPRFVDDLEPYPANASVLEGRSIYG